MAEISRGVTTCEASGQARISSVSNAEWRGAESWVRQHLEWCARCLDSDVTMAVEFRHRGWFAGEEAMWRTVSWLRSLRQGGAGGRATRRGGNVVLVASDDLALKWHNRTVLRGGCLPVPLDNASLWPSRVLIGWRFPQRQAAAAAVVGIRAGLLTRIVESSNWPGMSVSIGGAVDEINGR